MEYNISEKWIENLNKAKQHFKVADHMAYVTLTLLKDNRLIAKILIEAAESASLLVSALLLKENSLGKIKISKNQEENLKIFLTKIAPNYLEQKDIVNIVKLLELRKKHLDAHSEFVKKDKFVILNGDRYDVLTIEYIKELMSSARVLMIKSIAHLS